MTRKKIGDGQWEPLQPSTPQSPQIAYFDLIDLH